MAKRMIVGLHTAYVKIAVTGEACYESGSKPFATPAAITRTQTTQIGLVPDEASQEDQALDDVDLENPLFVRLINCKTDADLSQFIHRFGDLPEWRLEWLREMAKEMGEAPGRAFLRG